MNLKTNRLRVFQPQYLLWLSLPLLVWWALWQVPFKEMLAILRSLSLWSIFVLIAINTGIFAMFSGRWWLILRAQGYRVSYLSLIGYRLAAFGVTYATPGPQFGGEPLQAYLLHRREGVPGAEATASVILDRLLELLTNFAFLFIGVTLILAMGLLAPQVKAQAFLVPLSLLALPGSYLLALRTGRLPLSWILQWMAKRFSGERFSRIARLIDSSEGQVARFFSASPGTVLLALGISILVWAALIFEFSLALQFLGVRMALPQVVVALTAARIAFLMPAPGGLGVLEASQVLAMQALGFSPALGFSLSLVIRARDVTFGLVGLWLGGKLSR
jgi:glycosyltransferase 2 family protein